MTGKKEGLKVFDKLGPQAALQHIINRFRLTIPAYSPIDIPNTGRNDLACLFAELGYTRGVEIGTEQGIYAEILCKANPGLKLACVDAWAAYKGYRDHVSQDKLDGFYLATEAKLSRYDVEMVRMFSRDALGLFDDNSLDFVYIDANHELPFVIFDIIEWSKKVRPGGIVSGHDYYRSTRQDSKNHVVEAVHAYAGAYRIHPWFILGSKAKNPGETRDDSRSWMWVKK